ncbi:DJA6 [Symbiodinium sp. CCMP2592]|nr:DJA6 [Symbiodinium sp. CCMP2592]
MGRDRSESTPQKREKVYVATHKAACPNGSDCNYCHLRHPQRRATFDKRQREFFRSLEEGDLLSVILPHLKTKAASMPPSAQKVLGLLSARCLAARQGSSAQVELPENLNAVLEHMNFAWLVTLAPCKDEPEVAEAMEALRSDCVRATREEDPWVVLGVPKSADAGEVRRAFRARVRGAHPDLGGDPERFRSLNKAYDRAMAKLEGRELPPEPAAEAAPPAVKVPTPTPTEKPRKSPSTLEDFRSWRQQQQFRRDSRRRVENEQRRHRRGVSLRRQADERAAQQYQFQVERALEEVETPEERAMWEREAEMDLIRPQMMAARQRQARRRELQNRPYWERQKWVGRRSSSAPEARGERRPAVRSHARGERRQRSSREPPPGWEVDAHVGNRTVNLPDGPTTVKVFQTPEGVRYYVSPSTSRRVPIP